MATGLASARPREEVSAPAFEHPSPRPVDLVHLRRFTFGDRALEIEILGLFLEQTPKTVAMLREASGGAEWKMAAHSLKGAARAVGAWRVARMGEQAERLAFDEASAEQRREMVLRVEAAVAEAEAFLGAIMR